MSDLFVPGETIIILKLPSITIFPQTNSKIWDRNYFLQGNSNMEPDPEKFTDICNIKQF